MWPECGVDHPLPSSGEAKERVELYVYSPSGPSWPVLGRTLPFRRQVNLTYKIQCTTLIEFFFQLKLVYGLKMNYFKLTIKLFGI